MMQLAYKNLKQAIISMCKDLKKNRNKMWREMGKYKKEPAEVLVLKNTRNEKSTGLP